MAINLHHKDFYDLGMQSIKKLCRNDHVIYDVKYLFKRHEVDGRL